MKKSLTIMLLLPLPLLRVKKEVVAMGQEVIVVAVLGIVAQ